jgi:NDP-4-keto-2,6-dideoxyhexose 3-C-methyltransferase
MLKQTAFDNILHEHLLYLSLRSLSWAAKEVDLHLLRASTNDVNGGSMRVYLGRDTDYRDGSVENLLRKEPWRNDFPSFLFRVNDRVEKLRDFLLDCQLKGKVVDILGASTKGNVFLQLAGIHGGLIRRIEDAQAYKHGLKTLGTGIPIITEGAVRDYAPDYKLIMPWHFLAGIKKSQGDYLAQGGKLVVPLPDFEVIG